MFKEDQMYADSKMKAMKECDMETELAEMEMSTMEDDVFFDVDMDE